MIAFPFMLLDAAKQAGMTTPPEHLVDEGHYDRADYPHWSVFCALQLGVPMHPGEHWENAKVIAAVPDDEIRLVTLEMLKERGFSSKAM